MTKNLIELMGGRIWLASNAGLGSWFHFEWAFVVSLEASVRRPRVDLSGLRVLVVDDNTTNGPILADSLTRWRMRPVTVRNGADALEALRQAREERQAFPLMLLDMCMPEMDGLMVADAVRAGMEPRPAMIMLSSAARVSEAATHGIARTLLKPVGSDELFDAIAAAVGICPAERRAVERAPSTFPAAASRSFRILLA